MRLVQWILSVGVVVYLACAPGAGGQAVEGQIEARGKGAAKTAAAVRREGDVSSGVNREMQVAVGRGATAAELAAWVREPRAGTAVRGTVLFLHGFLADHHQLTNAGEALREAGYRSVLVDLRGFGESTGTKYTFGVLDAQDLKELVDVLQHKGLCGSSLGVYGTSYGAAAAILYAAIDPRVTTVVAVAPFARIRDEVPVFSRSTLGGAGALFSDTALNALADAVSRVVDLDLDDARPLEAIGKTRAEILLIHGDADHIIPHSASEILHAMAAGHSVLKTIANRGHLDLCFDVRGELYGITRSWFDRHLGGGKPPPAMAEGK